MYHIPKLYSFSHVLIGYLGYSSPSILIWFVIYQLYQYCINRRFFLVPYYPYPTNNKRYQDGNTIDHTLHKLFECVIGIIVHYVVDLLR